MICSDGYYAMLAIKWASYDYIAYSTGKCLLQVKNGVIQMVLLFLGLTLNLFKWELGENQLYSLNSNISFQSFTKGQITECSGPPLHKACVSTTNSHAISNGFSETKQYILWEIIRGVPDRKYSIYSKNQSVIQFSWIQLFYVFSRIVYAREKYHTVYIMPLCMHSGHKICYKFCFSHEKGCTTYLFD